MSFATYDLLSLMTASLTYTVRDFIKEILLENNDVNNSRRRFLAGATSVVGGAGLVGAAIPFFSSWKPSAKAKAAGAPVKVNISKLEPGGRIVVEWRGKPVYIVRRTVESIRAVNGMAPEMLKDSESSQASQPSYVQGAARTLSGKEEFLIMLGLCTHLGCAPTYRPDVGAKDLGGESWLGGFFCPCHGSKFDLSGRVYAGAPAPTNLEIPPHSYESSDILIIGVDPEEV